MAKVKIQGHASGTGILTVTAPNTSTDRTITLPDATGTLLNSDGDGSSLTGVGGDLSFGGDTFGADKTIGSNDTYSLSFETDGTERLQLHSDGRGLSQFTAKVWVNFDGSGTVSITDSHNVSSITDNGTGTYVVNFTSALGSADYAGAGVTASDCKVIVLGSNETTSLAVDVRQSTNGTMADTDRISLIVFGD